MLEGLVAPLLNRFLGMYIRNFDPTQLRLGIWNGDVKLQNLALRREALDQLHLPINVVAGHVGELKLTIPWANLKGKAVEVYIEDVFLLAAPKEDAAYDEEEEERRQQAVKMEKLDSAELIKERTGEGLSQEDQQKNQSFTDSVVTKIVDNLQVTVKNIHIRYEDSISTPGHPFALGFTLEGFSAVSTDGDWKPAFISTSHGVTHKLATLDALAVYWNTDSALLDEHKAAEVDAEAQGKSHDEMLKKFRTMIVRADSSTKGEHQFVLRPVSGQARVIIDKTGKTDQPRLRASLLFDEIGFMLDDHQYRDALMMVDLFHYFLRHQEYKRYQPKGVTPKEDPRAWLQFGVNAVLSKIHERNRRWTWDYFRERRDDRQRYIELFKKKKKEQAMSSEEVEEVNNLERRLSYQDLRFWRSLARNQLRKENALISKTDEQPKQNQGWGAWLWGSTKKEEPADGSTEMTEQQRKALYDAIDWDEKNAITESVDLPRDSVKLEVEASLKTGSFTLKRDPHGRSNEVLSTLFDNFNAKFLQRPDSMLAHIGLEGLRVYDGTTDGTLFPQMVSVKNASSIPDEKRIEELDDESKDETQARGVSADPFFDLEFEQNPLDGRANSALTVKLQSMEVIYNPQFIVEIAKFFKPPERHMESIGALMETAGATVEEFRQQTRAGLEFALEEHKTIDAKLDLQAPLIIIPGSVTTQRASCLILDAGHISMNSELVEPATIRNVQSKQKQQLSDEDYKRLEGLMYDKFLLKLKSTQVLIGPSLEETKGQLLDRDDSKNLHIIDRINVDLVVETSILPKAPNLTKLRVSGHLPVLQASVSDTKYKSLMKLIDVAIPKFRDDLTESQGGSKESRPSQKEDRRRSKDAASASERRRPPSTAFQFSAQQHALILEDEDTDHEADEQYEEASEGVHDEKLRLSQRNFELKFTVDRLQGCLFKADPEGKKPDKLLVELVAEHFGLNFYLRPFDMVAKVRLNSLVVEDHIETDSIPDFKRIVSSEAYDADDARDLFHVKFVRVNRESPEFMTTYDGIETNLDVSVSTINLVVTRRTLLTLLDFVLLTFTNQDASPAQAKTLEDEEDVEDEQEPAQEKSVDATKPNDSGKIRVKVDLKSIILILNDDGVRLATLSLNTADVGIFLKGKTMRIGTRIGDLSLLDDINQGASEDSTFRQLITIQGKELADFSYETFDSAAGDSYPGYDSSIFLRSGSVKVNFLEEPFRKIIEFMVKFGKMQAIFNAARQAAMNQANSIQENAGKMHFDILMKTPILVFPRVASIDRPRKDLLTAYLGEIYASNKFVRLDDSEKSATANKLSAGIRNIRLTSDFHYYKGDVSEELELLDGVDLNFHLTYLEHREGLERPDLEIQGSMSDFNLRVTQTQFQFLLELSTSVPAAFATDPEMDEEEVKQELPKSTVKDAQTLEKTKATDKDEKAADLGPELAVESQNWTKLDFVFRVQTVGLELILAKENEPVHDIDGASLSKFSLNDTNVKLRMISDGSIESEFLIQSFTIKDSRTRDTNKFRKIMSSTNNEVQQFMASVTISGASERNLIAILTIDSPRIIFALDYLFAIQAFFTTALATSEEADLDEATDMDVGSPTIDESDSTNSVRSLGRSGAKVGRHVSSRSEKSSPQSPDSTGSMAMSVAFRVNVVDAQVILIANPSSGGSEAIVLGTKQILLSQQHALTLQISQVGMFLCRMDQFETTRLRILDDFTLQMSMDTRSQALLTSVHIGLEPLILRLSLRDILLALDIVNRASELSSSDDSAAKDTTPKKIKDGKGSSTALRRRSGGGRKTSTMANQATKTIQSNKDTSKASALRHTSSAVMRREELTAQMEGLRVVLIGDLHELPFLDLSVRPFDVTVRDWSGQMNGDTNIDMYTNIYNFSKSAWEPLIEPWQLGFHMSKDQNPDRLSVEFYSRKTLEVTLTSASIALAIKSAHFLSQDDDVLSKPRGVDTPYKIRNQTGFEIDVWAVQVDQDQSITSRLTDGEEIPWRFQDWEKMRETLSSESGKGVLGVRLEGSGFDSIGRVPVSREGDKLYNLRPRKAKVTHRLLVEVVLGTDNVKYVTFRSPLLVENKTQIPVEIGVFDAEEGHLLKIEKVAPGESRPAPVGAAFMHSLLFRPDQGFGYTWSDEQTHWRDLLKRSTKTITCRGENGEKTPAFFFQLSANYDKSNPLTR